ncbi:MAG: hypothetical protein IH897_11750 [Planctomycetes bacterium]|nr:hypothetical protein [Planctomycetota bacterium]
MIDLIEQDVGEKLAGQVTDRQSFWTEHVKQVVARKVGVGRFFSQNAFSGGNDPADEVHESRVANCAGENIDENLVVDIWKETHNVSLQIEAMSSQKLLGTFDCPVRSLAFATRIAVENESSLIDWFENPNDGVVHNSVLKRSGTDFASFRVEDEKVTILTRRITAVA